MKLLKHQLCLYIIIGICIAAAIVFGLLTLSMLISALVCTLKYLYFLLFVVFGIVTGACIGVGTYLIAALDEVMK